MSVKVSSLSVRQEELPAVGGLDRRVFVALELEYNVDDPLANALLAILEDLAVRLIDHRPQPER